MPIDDFLNTTPPPPMGPADLGLPALPPPPQVPQQPQRGGGLMQTIMQAVPGILGGAMGPGAGTGLLQGAVLGQQRNDQQRRLDHQEAMQAYQWQQRAYEQQARDYEQTHRQREQILQQTLTSLRTQTKDAPDKAAYDAYVEAYGNGLQSMGYRVDANWLRKAVPYVAPKVDQLAWETLERWQKLPNNKSLLEKHPEQAANAMIPFDRDGDGIPELIRLQDLSILAGAPLAQSEAGVVFSNPGTTQEVKANADGILQQLIVKAKAEGKQLTPELTMKLQQEAIKIADQAKPKPGPDPTLQAIRELQLQNATNAPRPEYPPATQRRIDAKVRAFDMQPVVKRAQTMAEAVTFANSLDINTKSPADDQALIYAFAKAMDPESVVREGEYATVQRYAQSWAESFGFNAARVFTNTAFLTPEARANMKATIQRRFEATRGSYENLRQNYARQINRITGTQDGADLLVDYGGAFPDAMPDTTNDPAASARQKLLNR